MEMLYPITMLGVTTLPKTLVFISSFLFHILHTFHTLHAVEEEERKQQLHYNSARDHLSTASIHPASSR